MNALGDFYASLKALCVDLFRLRLSPRPVDRDWRTHAESLDGAKESRDKCRASVNACLANLATVAAALAFPDPWLGDDPETSKYIRLKRSLETVRFWLHECQKPFRGFKMPMDQSDDRYLPEDQRQHDDPADVASWNEAEQTIRTLGDELRDWIDLQNARGTAGPALPPAREPAREKGNLPAAMERATADADALVEGARTEPRPDLAELYAYTCDAFNAACDIARGSRGAAGLSPSQFVGQQVLLDECINRAKKLLEETDAINHWPTTPGTTFSWKAGDSALSVAYQFAQDVCAATLYARVQTLGILGHQPPALRVADPDPDPKIVAWRDAAMKELLERTLPAPPAWPMWEIHRDVGKLGSLLRDEYQRAMQVPATTAPTAARSDAEFRAWLLSSDSMPRLADEELARLRALLSVPIRLSELQRDPTKADERGRLNAVVRYNDEYRRAAQIPGTSAPPARGPAPTSTQTPALADEAAAEPSPTLTKAEQVALRALASFDPSILASVRQIVEAMDPDDAVSQRTVTPAVAKLVKLDLAERPEGNRRGTRLTLNGRRLAGKMPEIAY